MKQQLDGALIREGLHYSLYFPGRVIVILEIFKAGAFEHEDGIPTPLHVTWGSGAAGLATSLLGAMAMTHNLFLHSTQMLYVETLTKTHVCMRARELIHWSPQTMAVETKMPTKAMPRIAPTTEWVSPA